MDQRTPNEPSEGRTTGRRLWTVCFLGLFSMAIVPTASAHGAGSTPSAPQWYGLLIASGGLLVIVGSVALKRTERLGPRRALAGLFLGVVVTAVGGIWFSQLASEAEYTAQSMPFPRAWYQPVALLFASLIMVGSMVLGRLRWPTRPQYSVLGIELGLWIAYPVLLTNGEYTSPFGYVLVLSVPLTIGYILWRDCRGVISTVLRDRTARRFGSGVALTVALFFMFAAGFLSFFPEEGVNAPETATVAVLPTLFPLVTWPTVEWFFPSIPFVGMLSIGVFVVLGLLGGLIGLNAAMVARLWTSEGRTELTESTVGTAAFVGANACSCCGPIVGQLIILVAGSSAAAPVYWLFVDLASPAGTLFLVVSIALLTASLLHTVWTLADSPVCTVGERPSASSVRAD